jgi:hypothetical protein
MKETGRPLKHRQRQTYAPKQHPLTHARAHTHASEKSTCAPLSPKSPPARYRWRLLTAAHSERCGGDTMDATGKVPITAPCNTTHETVGSS